VTRASIDLEDSLELVVMAKTLQRKTSRIVSFLFETSLKQLQNSLEVIDKVSRARKSIIFVFSAILLKTAGVQIGFE
jgi:hypothetical protein